MTLLRGSRRGERPTLDLISAKDVNNNLSMGSGDASDEDRALSIRQPPPEALEIAGLTVPKDGTRIRGAHAALVRVPAPASVEGTQIFMLLLVALMCGLILTLMWIGKRWLRRENPENDMLAHPRPARLEAGTMHTRTFDGTIRDEGKWFIHVPSLL